MVLYYTILCILAERLLFAANDSSHHMQSLYTAYHTGLVDTDSCPDESVHHISVAMLTCNVEWSSAILYDRDMSNVRTHFLSLSPPLHSAATYI